MSAAAMLYRTTHVTRYLYEGPVSQCLSEVRLTPRNLAGQTVVESGIEIDPEPAVRERRRDYFGNEVNAFSIFRGHDRFTITGRGLVKVDRQPPDLSLSTSWEAARDLLSRHPDEAALEALEFVFDSPYVTSGPELAEYAQISFAPGRPLAEALRELTHRIHTEFTYLPESTSIDMPLIEAFRNRCGVCQDFSHIMIGALRSLRLAARYVSGYLRSGAKYTGAEASHAWVSAWVPGVGWLDLDPTNDVIPGNGHVVVALGRDYSDVTPVNGIAVGGGEQIVKVEVRVEPVIEPRP